MHYKARRSRMVQKQLVARGISDLRVLKAMGNIPRERFVSEDLVDDAYDDRPLLIGYEQTISQPYIVAMMTEALKLKGGEHVLEIGTGSGYAAAVLADIAGSVVTIECIVPLAVRATNVLSELDYHNVAVIQGDGGEGYPEQAPYDAIVVTAGGPEVPVTLLKQLKLGGRLVMPIGPKPHLQELVRVKRLEEDEFSSEYLGAVRFVPLVGAAGWPESASAVLH